MQLDYIIIQENLKNQIGFINKFSNLNIQNHANYMLNSIVVKTKQKHTQLKLILASVYNTFNKQQPFIRRRKDARKTNPFVYNNNCSALWPRAPRAHVPLTPPPPPPLRCVERHSHMVAAKELSFTRRFPAPVSRSFSAAESGTNKFYSFCFADPMRSNAATTPIRSCVNR